MEPILDKHGNVVANLQDNAIVDTAGNVLAIVRSGHVRLIHSEVKIGRLDRGIFRDVTEKVVAFLPGCVGSLASAYSLTSVCGGMSCRAVFTLPPGGWSALTWREFIDGSECETL
jgi:hypothetical protein